MTPLLEIEHLVKRFPVHGGLGSHEVVHAVEDVSLAMHEGETLALVGESGCGKSTLARCIVRLHRPTSGTIRFAGRDITSLGERALRPLRRDLQMVFQDPYDSLNGRRRIAQIVGDPLRAHGVRDPREIEDRVGELLAQVGLAPDHGRRYPWQFSGGQRQRIGIARALALKPRLVIADEPVSALDVSIQAQVINLMLDLQRELKLTYLVISHDLGLVRQLADRIGVMYLGRIVEIAPNEALYDHALHPYTEALLAAAPVPTIAAARRPRVELRGDPPSPTRPPPGCPFHTRCRYATDVCRTVDPPLVDYGGGHLAACHHPRFAGVAERAGATASAQGEHG